MTLTLEPPHASTTPPAPLLSRKMLLVASELGALQQHLALTLLLPADEARVSRLGGLIPGLERILKNLREAVDEAAKPS